MALSKKRIVAQVVLLLILFALVGLVYVGYTRQRPETLWRSAEAAREAGDLEEAKIRLMKLLQTDPEHADAHFALARVLLAEAQQKDPEAGFATHPAALAHLEAAARLQPQEPRFLKPLLAAYLRRGQFNGAASIAERLAKQDPDESDVLFARAWAAVAGKDYKRAQPLLEKLATQSGEPRIRTLQLQVEVYDKTAQRKPLDDALQASVRQAANLTGKISGRDAAVLTKLLGLSLMKTTDVELALQRFATGVRFQERRSKTAGRPVAAAAGAAELVRAASWLRTKVKGKTRKTYNALLDRAIAVIETGAASKGAGAALEGELYTAAVYRGDRDRALRYLEEGLARQEKRKGGNGEVELELRWKAAQRLAELRRYRSALAHVDVLLKSDKWAPRAHLLAGRIDAAEGRFQSSLYHLRQAQQRLGQNIMVNHALALAYAATGRWDEALPYLRSLQLKIDKLPPAERDWAKAHIGDGSGVRMLLARANLAVGNAERADELLKSFDGTRNEPRALTVRVADTWNRDRKAASALLRKSREKYPQDLGLAGLDVQIHFLNNQPDVAQRIAEELAKARPDDATARILWYRTLMTRKKYAEAVRLLDDAAQRFPKHRSLLLLAKARTLLLDGKYAQAAALAQTLRKDSDVKHAAELIGAVAALKTHELKDAAQLLAAASAGERQSGSLGLLKGRLDLNQGDLDAAVRDLSSALKYAAFRSVAGASILQSLMQLAREKSPRDAAVRVDELLKQYPDEPPLILAKAEFQIRRGNFSDALQTLHRLNEELPNSSAAPYFLSRFWAGLNRLDKARRQIDLAVARSPRNLAARLFAIELAFRRNEPAEALEHAENGLQAVPGNPAFLMLKAQALAGLDRRGEAAALLADLTKKSPQNVQAWLRLARLRIELKQPAAALQVLAEARKHNPQDGTLIQSQIRLMYRQKQEQAADSLAEALTREKPEFPILLALTRTYAALGKLDAARRWAQQAESAARRTKDETLMRQAAFLLADVAMAQSRMPDADPKYLAEAHRRFAALSEKYPSHLAAANNLAWLLATRLNDPDGARRAVDRMRQAHPLHRLPPTAVDTILTVYLAQRDFPAAEQLLKDAMQMQPGVANWVRRYVSLAIERNRFEDAVPTLQAMHNQRRWWAEPSYGLARLNVAMGRRREALRLLERALSIDPDQLPARLLALKTARALHEEGAVVVHANALLKRSPDLWTAHEFKAAALLALSREDEARAVLNAAIHRLRDRLNSRPTAQGYLALARLIRVQDGDDQALVSVRSGLSQFPGDSSLALLGVGLLLKKKEFSEAESLAEEHITAKSPVATMIAAGAAFQQHGQSKTALAWAEKALQRATESDRPLAHVLKGDALRSIAAETGDDALFERARTEYLTVLKQHPRHPAAGNNLAWMLATRMNRPQEAVQVAERVRGDAPVGRLHLSFADTLSTVYRKAGEWEKAREFLLQATSRFPRHAKFHLDLAEVYLKTGDPRAAQQSVNAALQLGLPDNDRKLARQLRNEARARTSGSAKK